MGERVCSSLHEFRKIMRKYGKDEFSLKTYRIRNQQKYYTEWISIDITDSELFGTEIEKFAQRKENLPNLPIILQETREKYKKHEYIIDGEVYMLRGIEITAYDFYYLYISESGSKIPHSWVGCPEEIEYSTDRWKEEKENLFKDLDIKTSEEYSKAQGEFDKYYNEKYGLDL